MAGETDSPEPDSDSIDPAPQDVAPQDIGWRSKAAMIVPLVVFFLVGMAIDTSPVEEGTQINASAYMISVIARVVLMSAAILFFSDAIIKQFPVEFDRWGWLVGLVGAGLWIGACLLGLEQFLLIQLTGSNEWLPKRDGVDPFATYGDGAALSIFLSFRFILLVVCVPIAEELFLRGFLMRAVETEEWTSLSLLEIGRYGLIAGTAYGVLAHPGEILAATLWFSLVTWLMVRTGKFWNCVLAHAVTNLILGVYVCLYSQWHLW